MFVNVVKMRGQVYNVLIKRSQLPPKLHLCFACPLSSRVSQTTGSVPTYVGLETCWLCVKSLDLTSLELQVTWVISDRIFRAFLIVLYFVNIPRKGWYLWDWLVFVNGKNRLEVMLFWAELSGSVCCKELFPLWDELTRHIYSPLHGGKQ